MKLRKLEKLRIIIRESLLFSSDLKKKWDKCLVLCVIRSRLHMFIINASHVVYIPTYDSQSPSPVPDKISIYFH